MRFVMDCRICLPAFPEEYRGRWWFNSLIVVMPGVRSVIPRYRSRLRIFIPLCSLYALEKQLQGDPEYSFPCRGGIDFFFVSARDGKVYPCGYRGGESLGEFPDLTRRPVSDCRSCEWECFRDPSEIMGPLITVCQHPGRLFRRFRRDPAYRKLYWDDLRYYRACRFFDGRIAPESTGMPNFTA